MAAVLLVLSLFRSGDELIVSEDLYGERIDYFLSMKKWNVRCRYVNTQSIKQIEQAITTETKAIFIETPTNPLMQVTDILCCRNCSEKARTTSYCRQHILHTLYTATINRRC